MNRKTIKLPEVSFEHKNLSDPVEAGKRRNHPQLRWFPTSHEANHAERLKELLAKFKHPDAGDFVITAVLNAGRVNITVATADNRQYHTVAFNCVESPMSCGSHDITSHSAAGQVPEIVEILQLYAFEYILSRTGAIRYIAGGGGSKMPLITYITEQYGCAYKVANYVHDGHPKTICCITPESFLGFYKNDVNVEPVVKKAAPKKFTAAAMPRSGSRILAKRSMKSSTRPLLKRKLTLRKKPTRK